MKNNRTFLEKLLDGAEVEWKPLKDVAEYIRGVTYNKANESTNNIGYKVLRANNITLSGNTLNFDDIKVIKFDTKVKSSQMLYKNDILISAASGSREHVGKVAFIYQDIDYYFGGFMGVIRCNNNVNSRYLFHIFTSSIFQDYLNEVLNSSTINNLNSKVMDSFRLPIPPLSVQTEIVKILDALTALTSELTSELILRRKQYEYYREKLLSFDSLELLGGVVQWIKLIDLGGLIRGNGLQKKDFTETGVPAIHYGQIYTYYGTFATKTKSFVSPELAKKLKKVDYGDVVITNTSENFEDVGKAMVYLGKEQAVTGGHATIFKPNHEKILSKYFVYLTQTSFFTNEKRKYAKGTKVIDVSATDMAKIILPIPPLEEQHRIVSILDKFETLTNSITEGLPLAIEQSQKRYEYYRELLLNFS
jgi:type I restriction/modification specificity protein